MLVDTLVHVLAVMLLGLTCIGWTFVALPLLLVLPREAGLRFGRRGIQFGFRAYLWTLRRMGAYRLDLAGLPPLRDATRLVLAPNHPSLIDAVMIIAHNPRVACVMKSSLMNNVFLGAGARLARYISNEPPRHMIVEALAELERGGLVLLFPEGTRTTQAPINALGTSVAVVAKHAGVPVQTLLIEQDSALLSKGWSLFRHPRLPVRYRIRLGRRFDAPTDVRSFTLELEQYFRAELAESAQNRWIGSLPPDRRSA